MDEIMKKVLFPASRILPDKVYLTLAYEHFFGKKIDWNNPKTFNEKIQWLKVYDHNPIYIDMVDKYEAKKYMAKVVGEEYIIPSYGVWNSCNEIRFSDLPQRFVLKCTHDSGSVWIINNKKEIDVNKLKKEISKSLTRNFYWFGREWPYKNVKPRIIAEKLLESDFDIYDYKVFAFNGKARFMFVASDRNEVNVETKFDFFDMNFCPLDVVNGHPKSGKEICKPYNFEKMIEIAEALSKGLPQVRIDFYEVGKKLYVGEMTLYHWSGFKHFEPETWDDIFGQFIDLQIVGKK